MKDIDPNSMEEVLIAIVRSPLPLGFGLAVLREEGNTASYDDGASLCSARHPTRWSRLWERLRALPGRIAWAFGREDHF